MRAERDENSRMVICPHCQHVMLSQPVVCEGCGRMVNAPPRPTHVNQPTDETLVVKSGQLRATPRQQRVWRSAEVGQDAVVALHVNGKLLEVALEPGKLVLLGRFDPRSADSPAPDVDLETFGAFDAGVSRVHAALMMDNGCLMVKDAGSVNGTFVNNQRVNSNAWRMLRHQDELRLGMLGMTVSLD